MITIEKDTMQSKATLDIEFTGKDTLIDKAKQLEEDIKEMTKIPEQIEHDYEGIELKGLLK